MKKIKSLIARTIKNLGKLTTFALMIIPSFAICCLLGSWTIDPNGNLIGDNQYNIENQVNPNTLALYYSSNINDGIEMQEDREYTLALDVKYTQGEYFAYIITCDTYYNKGTPLQYYNANGPDWSNISNITPKQQISGFWRQGLGGFQHLSFTFNAQYKYLYIIITNRIQINLELRNIMLNYGQEEKWEPYGVYYSSQNYYDLQTQYNQALEGTEIDYTNYTIQLVNYPTSDTTSNYNVVQTLTTRDYVNEQGFLNIYNITQISGFGDTWDGIVITSTQYLNTYNYNLLFNGSGNSNLDFGLYYKYYESEKFRKISLMNIVGDSAYYGYFDLINLFSKNSIEENIQDILYNKFAIHWTNNPTPNDLINIKLNSTDGYNMGYAKGVQDNLINLEELNETIEEQTRQLQEKQKQYDELLDHYNNAQINNPLSQMVVSIADIPLNLFHEMFNFDIMGFNLSAFILGIITILLVAYVIKLFL